jgi:uncharacterized membrane protein YfcA
MDPVALAILACAAFAGAMVQAATGFGFAILAAPVFLTVMNSTVAVAVLIALHVVQSAQVVPALWSAIPLSHLRRLVLGGAIGCPAGALILQMLDVRMLKVALGVLIVGFVAMFVVRMRRPLTRTRPAAPQSGPPATLAGFASGVLTALLVMPGPPLMVLLASQQWPREDARALSLGFFACCYVAALALSVAGGVMGGAEWLLVGLLAPAVVLGTIAGARLGRLVPEARYRLVLLALMLLSGVGALVSGLAG